MSRHWLILLLLWPGLAMASLSPPPAFVVTWILDDVHRSWLDDYQTTTKVDVMTESVATPNMDAIANNGLRFDNFRSHSVCSPARAMFFGYGEIRRSTNLYGKIISSHADPAISTVVIQPEGDNLVRRLQAEGYQVAFFGKMHMGLAQSLHPRNTPFAERMGFDYYDVVMAGNNTNVGMCGTGVNPYIDECASHNWFCAHDSNGVSSMYGDGSSADDASNGFTGVSIIDAAEAFVVLKLAAAEKWWVFISPNAPHSPYRVAASGTTCAYPFGSDQPDDRVPGSVLGSGIEAVYNEMTEDLDTRIGSVNGKLHLAAGGLNHMVIIVGDNGTLHGTGSTECQASRGSKFTPYPCGVQVPLVMDGDNVTTPDATTEITGLMYAPDFPKTLIDIAAGGSGVSGSKDGISFASCLALPDPSTCTVSHDVICWQEWKPLGGVVTTLERPPQISTDAGGVWEEIEYSCSTMLHGGDYMLHRVYDDVTTPANFCEYFFDRTTDLYLATANAPLADNQGDCLSTTSADISGLTADQQLAFNLLNDKLNSMLDQDGHEEATHSGGGF